MKLKTIDGNTVFYENRKGKAGRKYLIPHSRNSTEKIGFVMAFKTLLPITVINYLILSYSTEGITNNKNTQMDC